MPTPRPALTHSQCTGAIRSVRDALDLPGGKWKLGLRAAPALRAAAPRHPVAGLVLRAPGTELRILPEITILW